LSFSETESNVLEFIHHFDAVLMVLQKSRATCGPPDL
jgi:hypothetical protein